MKTEEEYWESPIYHRRGSYDEYDHSDEELYVYDQCCGNCRFFRNQEFGSVCLNRNHDEFDAPADSGTDWCEYWRGQKRSHC